MDVKIIFVNGDIDHTIYMVQPESFVFGDTKVNGLQIKKVHLWA